MYIFAFVPALFIVFTPIQLVFIFAFVPSVFIVSF